MLSLLVFVQSYIATLKSQERGATMVEYGLVVAVIAIIALVGAKVVGVNLLAAFQSIAGGIGAPATTTTP